MNHPSLDICKIIGAEFPDSEFVHASRWTPYGTTRKVIARPILEFDEKNNQFYVEGTPIDWKIEAPAPTCEELGEWMLSWMKSQKEGEYFDYGEGILKSKVGASKYIELILFNCLYSGNETQARAEAVKIILEKK